MDSKARTQFWSLAERAKERGMDLAEVLDREGLLLTTRRRLDIQADALDQVAELLDTTTANQWTTIRATNLTPNDVQSGIADRLREMAQKRRNT